MILFETARLIARQFRPADFSDLYAICSDEQVMKYVGNSLPLSSHQVQEWIAVSLKNYARDLIGANAVVEKASQQLIGYCGIIESKDVEDYELIYGFDKKHWGKGYATEIATAMLEHAGASNTFDHIYASIDPENIASSRILKKLRFEFLFSTIDDAGFDTHYYLRKW